MTFASAFMNVRVQSVSIGHYPSRSGRRLELDPQVLEVKEIFILHQKPYLQGKRAYHIDKIKN
jgi:hypothetical protein